MGEMDASFSQRFAFLGGQVKTETFEKGVENSVIRRRFYDRFQAFSNVDEKRKRGKKYALSNEKVFAWTGGNKTKTLARVKIFCCVLV